MTAHTEHHILKAPDGTPLYVVVPWEDYEEHFGGRPDDEVTIPHAVIVIEDERGVSLIRAWREHLGLTQDEVARRMGVTRQAYLQMGSLAGRPRVATLKKIAVAMGVAWEQLRA